MDVLCVCVCIHVGICCFVLFSVYLVSSLGTEHRWCEDPIESALFIIIIRDRAPMVRGPY